MPGLLDEGKIDELIERSTMRTDKHIEALRSAMWSSYDVGGAPPGMKRLRTPQERQSVERLILKRAGQEQRGSVPGSLNSSMASHPAFREMVREDLTGEVPDAP